MSGSKATTTGSKTVSGGLTDHNLQTDNFGYSAVGLDALGASEYTLVTIVIDRSGSVASFLTELTACLKAIVTSCESSPRKDNLMLRIVQFGDDIAEIHGFKLLANCKPDDYTNAIQIGGNTALFDAASNAINAMSDWGKQLNDQDYTVNAVAFVMTDGGNNAGKDVSGASVKTALKDATKDEKLESLTSILIGVNVQDPSLKDELDKFHKEAGFTQFVDVGKADAKNLARLAAFVSKSISSVSQAKATGGPSQPVTF